MFVRLNVGEFQGTYFFDEFEVEVEDLDLLSTETTTDYEKVQIYPNPVKMELFVKISKKIAHIELYSILGKKVYDTTTFSGKIDVTKYPKGIYFLSLHTEEGEEIKRIVVIY